MGERTPISTPARGGVFGLSAIHTRKDMLRAVMEGVAYSLSGCMAVFWEMGASISNMMAYGGGGTSVLWRQMLADLYGGGVKTLAFREGAALGMALLAGVGAGVYASVPEGCGAVIRADRVQSPIPRNAAKYTPF